MRWMTHCDSFSEIVADFLLEHFLRREAENKRTNPVTGWANINILGTVPIMLPKYKSRDMIKCNQWIKNRRTRPARFEPCPNCTLSTTLLKMFVLYFIKKISQVPNFTPRKLNYRQLVSIKVGYQTTLIEVFCSLSPPPVKLQPHRL